MRARWREAGKGSRRDGVQCICSACSNVKLRWCDVIIHLTAVCEEQESEADYLVFFKFDASVFALINTKMMNWFKKGKKKAAVKPVLLLKDTRGLSCRNDRNCSRAIHVQFWSMEKCIWWSMTRLLQELFHRCFKALLSKARRTFSSHIAVFSVKNFTYISVCQSFSHLFKQLLCLPCKFIFFHIVKLLSFWDASLLMKPIYSQSWINLLKH